MASKVIDRLGSGGDLAIDPGFAPKRLEISKGNH
jgi:hypothetical protein